MIAFEREHLFLVTGASSGIGKATARLLVALGASVAAVGRSEQKLLQAKAESSRPENFHVHARDLFAETETLSAWIKDLRATHGKFHGMVSCAGSMYMDSVQSYDPQRANEIFALHLHIPMLLAGALADRRNNAGPGTSLVFVAALGGVVPQPGLLSYGAAKSALVLAARNLSKELGKKKIRVNTISPALVRTPMTETDYAGFMGYDVLAAEESQFPLGVGRPEDVAHAAAFLLAPQSGWITGQNFVLDGGRY